MLYRVSIAIVSTALIVSCGGTVTVPASVQISPEEQASRILAVDNGKTRFLGEVLSNGETITARSVSSASIFRNYNPETTELRPDVDVQVSEGSNGELVVSVNGESYNFVAEDRDPDDEGFVYGYNVDNENSFFALYVNGGTLDDLTDPDVTEYSYPIYFYWEPDELEGGTFGNAIIGVETRDSVLRGLGSATYQGDMAMTIVSAEDFGKYRQRGILRGDTALEVDFGGGTISGVIDALRYEPRNEAGPEASTKGRILLEEAAFGTNGYAAGISLDDDALQTLELTEIGDGSGYSGAFYGPDAYDAAGVLTLTGNGSDGALNGVGHFSTRIED